MVRKIAFLGLGLSLAACQVSAQVPPPPATASDSSAMLRLSQGQLNVVAEGLAELPYKLAAPVIQAIQGQIVQGQQATASKPAGLTGPSHPGGSGPSVPKP